MGGWLFKTEPETYSWQDLLSEGKTVWDGVKGALALKNLARMRPGERVFIYHTGKEKRIVGLAEVAGDPYIHPDHPGTRMFLVELKPVRALTKPVTLKQIKESAANRKSKKEKNPWEGWDLLRIPRLSVVPVNDEQWRAVMALAGCPG